MSNVSVHFVADKTVNYGLLGEGFMAVRKTCRYHLSQILTNWTTYVTAYDFGTLRMRWTGHVARMGEDRGVYRVLMGKPEGRRPLGRPRRRWADNIRMDLQEVGCVYMDCIGLAQDRDRWRTLVSAVMNLRVA